jgi:hypothetical protein
MSLHYFLYCRKNYERIIQHLEYIIDIFDDINYMTISEFLDSYELTHEKQNNKINFFIEKLAYVKNLKDDCSREIQQLCCHDYVDDVIDVAHERSEHITYCSICETMKP